MASGALLPKVKVAGLERAARLAGEAFGHEDAALLPRLRWTAYQPLRLPMLLGILAAVLALSVFALR